MHYSILILAVLSIFLASSCGKRDAPATQPDPYGNLTLAENEEKTFWQEPECIRGQLSGKGISDTTISVWDQPGGRALKIDPSKLKLVDRYGLPSVDSLGGEFIARDVYRRRCINIDDNGICLDSDASAIGWKPFLQGTPPRFCQIKQDYESTSLERVSLTIMYNIKKSRDFLVKHYFNGKPETFGQIDVKILPLFESIRPSSDDSSQDIKTIEVNNVMYFPSFSSRQKPFLAFLPRSETLALAGTSAPLWQNPFVHAHELSHHLEKKWDLDQFNKTRSIGRKALSEAFADIIAFQATEWGLTNRSLSNSACLSERGLDNKFFSDGLAKRLTPELLARLESKPKTRGSESDVEGQLFWKLDQGPCTGISGTHYGLAAIFGSAFFESLEVMMARSNISDLTLDEKQAHYSFAAKEFLTLASKTMKAGTTLRNDSDIVLNSIASAIMETAKKANVSLDRDSRRILCKNLNSYFPYQSNTTWFESENCNDTSL